MQRLSREISDSEKSFFFTRWNCKNFKGSDSEKVVDAMIEVCGNYSIPIFDCARKGSIYADNDTFRRIYFQKSKNNTDTAHLNSKGHDRFLKSCREFSAAILVWKKIVLFTMMNKRVFCIQLLVSTVWLGY